MSFGVARHIANREGFLLVLVRRPTRPKRKDGRLRVTSRMLAGMDLDLDLERKARDYTYMYLVLEIARQLF